MRNNIKTYSELISLPTFEDRFNYLKMYSNVGNETFGNERFINQRFYRSREWADIRNQIIIRDCGCDLAVKGCDIFGKIIIHHMNPIMLEDITEFSDFLVNPEYLVCVSHDTHNAIHFGTEKYSNKYEERRPNDLCPWKQ